LTCPAAQHIGQRRQHNFPRLTIQEQWRGVAHAINRGRRPTIKASAAPPAWRRRAIQITAMTIAADSSAG